MPFGSKYPRDTHLKRSIYGMVGCFLSSPILARGTHILHMYSLSCFSSIFLDPTNHKLQPKNLELAEVTCCYQSLSKQFPFRMRSSIINQRFSNTRFEDTENHVASSLLQRNKATLHTKDLSKRWCLHWKCVIATKLSQ